MARDTIFISYSHADRKYLDRFKVHLAPLEAQGALDVWEDTRIDSGGSWQEDIRRALDRAKAGVLLISPSFLASSFIRGHELPSLLAAAQADGLVIVPVFVSPSVVNTAKYTYSDPTTGLERTLQLTVFQGINGPGKTLSEMEAPRRDRILASLAEELTKLGSPKVGRPIEPPAASGANRGVCADLSHHQAKWEHLREFFDREGSGITSLERGPLSSVSAIGGCSSLVVALPWHDLLSREEIDHVEKWVRGGGSLLLLGYYAADTHHESNPSHLARAFGFEFGDDLVMPPGKTDDDCRAHVFSLRADLSVNVAPDPNDRHPILDGVREMSFLSSCTIRVVDAPNSYVLVSPAVTDVWQPEGPKDPEGWRKIITRWTRDREAPVPILAASPHGMGRVVVAGTWKLLTLDIGDNARLVKNLLTWLSSRSGSTDAMVADAGARGAALAPGVELGPFGDREIIDPHASQVIGELRSIHRRLQTPSLPMRDLFGELDILFDRKTFRNEAVSECTSQGWSDRLHAAYQTVEILRAYQRNVRDAGTREQYDNYRKVVDDVDDYAMNMSIHLFHPAVRYEDIREHIGSKEFYARLPPERKFPIGQNGKLELPAPIAAACDPHRKRAGDHMRRLYDSVR